MERGREKEGPGMEGVASPRHRKVRTVETVCLCHHDGGSDNGDEGCRDDGGGNGGGKHGGDGNDGNGDDRWW